jgi:hypothetical protein
VRHLGLVFVVFARPDLSDRSSGFLNGTAIKREGQHIICQ